ncbi:hypothetical protein ACFVWG_26060 [Kribbella sp. NPDC058245]|uniref:hypothetical protein n=1 Tax=Kribbella sp. NPDC058245 TaxID=3346399 RepID=UPI0036E721A6
MTNELKALMERESDRPDHYFAPDPAAILTAGRRRSRVRNLTAGTTVLTALVVLVAGAIVVLPKHQDAPVAGLPTRSQDSYKQCDTSQGRRLGKNSWTWPEIVTLMDANGSASLRRDPADPGQVAFCVTQREKPTGDLALGQNNGMVVRVTPVNQQSSVVTVFGRTYGDDGRTVLVAVGNDSGSALPQNIHALDNLAAVSPASEAKIVGTYYAVRVIQPSPWPGDRPQVSTAGFDPNGYRINFAQW